MPNQALEGLKAITKPTSWLKKLPTETGTQVEELRQHLKEGHKDFGTTMKDSRDLPFVPPPSSFQPDPLVVGSPELARSAKMVLDLDPWTKQNVSKIVHGPTRATMELMLNDGFSPEAFNGTTLRGAYNVKDHEIAIRPNLRGSDALGTLVHEIGHAAGYGEEGAVRAKEIISKRKTQ